jgi:Arc/MetJ-type ribon-helix-helix transcriptional regulator
MTMEAIKDAITHPSEQERKQLADWFQELDEAAWDRQMEQDFAPAGRGAHLLEKLDRQIEAGNFTSLEEGLRQRRPPERR